MLAIKISNQQKAIKLDRRRLQSAVKKILTGSGIRQAEVSLAFVDDPTIHQINRDFLKHDYPTDVLSFLLEREVDQLEGEVVASADTAIRYAKKYGWDPADELLLYVIHGTLHLVGFDDTSAKLQKEMRQAERAYLGEFGLKPRY